MIVYYSRGFSRKLPLTGWRLADLFVFFLRCTHLDRRFGILRFAFMHANIPSHFLIASVPPSPRPSASSHHGKRKERQSIHSVHHLFRFPPCHHATQASGLNLLSRSVGGEGATRVYLLYSIPIPDTWYLLKKKETRYRYTMKYEDYWYPGLKI